MEIAIGVIGVTDAALRASSKLWALSTAWRDAPADLHMLRDDLTRTERFFGDIQEHFQSKQLRGYSSPGDECFMGSFVQQADLGRLVDEGAVTLRRIEAIVDGLVAGDAIDTQSVVEKAGELGKRRKFLWLRHSRKIARLRKELDHTRSSICRLLIAQNVSMSAEIHTSLEQSRSEFHSQLSKFSVSLDASQDAMLAQLEDRIQDMERRILLAVQSDSQKGAQQQVTPYTHPPPFELASSRESPFSPSRVSLCDKTPCPCTCHRATSYRWRLTLLRSLVGVVAVAHNTRGSMACTNPACLSSQLSHARPIHDLYVTYHLPSWLARTSVSAFLTTNLNGSPQMNLRVYYRRSPEESLAPLGIGRLIDKGDVAGVKAALQSGRASVYDLYGQAGHTALWKSVNVGRADITKLLQQSGVDPFHKDDAGRSVIAIAFQLWCTGVPAEKALGDLFPISRYLEEADFSALHRAVLVGVDLAKMLANPAILATINSTGGDGWTPLHLAAMKGDAVATKQLLRVGAHVDCRTVAGVTPLYYACRYGHYGVAKALLAGGADARVGCQIERQAIHGAATSVQARSIIALLLQHGADINAQGTQQYPPLMYAVIWGTMDAVKCLIDNGANLAGHDRYGATMIMMAIRTSRHHQARLLLERGAPLGGIDEDGRCTLHHLATNGDQEMVEIFAGTQLWRGFDLGTSSKDRFGLTPLGVFLERKPDEKLREAFNRLLDWVESFGNAENLIAGSEEDMSDDEFFDAEDGIGGTDKKYNPS